MLVAQYENVDSIKKWCRRHYKLLRELQGKEKISMLEEVLHNRHIENEFLAGGLIHLVKKIRYQYFCDWDTVLIVKN